MIDHKAEAEELLVQGIDFADPRNGPTAAAQQAQVHATLYLAEQQRIANLMAYSEAFLTSEVGELSMRDEVTLNDIEVQIRDGLGLS